MPFVRITITQVSHPANQLAKPGLNDELQRFGASMGFFSDRDKDKSKFRIFIALLKSLKGRGQNQGLSSDEIAFELALSRATVIHHINNLMESGLVSNVRGRYVLNVSTLEELVNLTQNNINRTFEDLKKVARDIDKRMEL